MNLNETFIGDGVERIKGVYDVTLPCTIPWETIFWYFFVPLIVALLLFIILKFKEELKAKLFSYYGKRGYIRIYMILDNKRLKDKIIKLDKYNNFRIKEGKYTLEKMYDYILAYDKYGFPIFLFDDNFILPLKITNETLTEEIKEEYGIVTEDKKDINQIKAVMMKIDSKILKTVYDKKLLSDLYSISGDVSKNRMKIIYIIIGIVILAVLYYTGDLQKILDFVI